MPCSDPIKSPEHDGYNARVDENNREAARLLCDLEKETTDMNVWVARLQAWLEVHRALDRLRNEILITDPVFRFYERIHDREVPERYKCWQCRGIYPVKELIKRGDHQFCHYCMSM